MVSMTQRLVFPTVPFVSRPWHETLRLHRVNGRCDQGCRDAQMVFWCGWCSMVQNDGTKKFDFPSMVHKPHLWFNIIYGLSTFFMAK